MKGFCLSEPVAYTISACGETPFDIEMGATDATGPAFKTSFVRDADGDNLSTMPVFYGPGCLQRYHIVWIGDGLDSCTNQRICFGINLYFSGVGHLLDTTNEMHKLSFIPGGHAILFQPVVYTP
jgi:hypothetical protein